MQNATGLRVDHYMGIGFGGLVNVVDAVGGVRMCIPQNLDDPASGLHLKKGCQNLSGAEALGFVRTRHLFATQDLQREQNQRVVHQAPPLTKMTSVGTLANPFTAFSAANRRRQLADRGQGHSAVPAVQVAFALRHPETTTVPIVASETLAVGDVLVWDQARGAADVRRDEERPARAQEPDHRLESRLTSLPRRGREAPARRCSRQSCKLRHIGPLRSPWLPSYHASNCDPVVAVAWRFD